MRTIAHPTGESQSLADSALFYRSLGLHPIPCRPNGKEALIEWTPYQKEPPHTDEIVMWWERWPEANIALVLGRGMFVVDLDGAGAEGLLTSAGIILPKDAPRVKTGKGYHVYLSAPCTIPNITALFNKDGSQVDIKGDGGYVLAPPSIHPSGAVYEWIKLW